MKLVGIYKITSPSGRVYIGQSWNVKQRTKRQSAQTPRGESHPQARLTETKVREIRQKYKPNIYTKRRLAREYETSIPNIKAILSGRLWAHVQ